ncbi:hypothetical protein FQN53_004254 [Emmonsiellopsis sp. PD_33]|nr:hypothetical protein FQN53_004254 [Emmonsiellopsis sp. PD_33]
MVSPKPDSSYSSTHMTRKNYGGKPLLSQVRGRPTRNSSGGGGAGNATSPTSTPSSNKKAKTRPEPATDDEPISSSDESDQLSSRAALSSSPEPKRKSLQWSARDLVDSLKGGAEADSGAGDGDGDGDGDGEEKRDNKRRKKNMDPPREGERRSGRVQASSTSPPKRQPPRGLRAGGDRVNVGRDTGSLFPSIVSSSQSMKIKPPRVYTTMAKMPYNIHTAPKDKDKASAAPKFKLPGGDGSDSPVHSSQATSSAPKFRNPLEISNDFISTSSMPTSTSLENDALLFDLDGDESSLSSASSVSSPTSLHSSEKGTSYTHPAIRDLSRCPVCGGEVDPKALENASSSARGFGYRKQVQFCRSHKVMDAEKEWAERGYPRIDLERLQQRIKKYYSELDKILTCKRTSFYRNALESSGAGSKRGNLRLTVNDEDGMEKISTGYYGPAGAKKMMDAIIGHFAVKFNSLAPSDNLIKAVGVSGFVQSVMVPELAVMLIKEDMGVGDSEARQVMRDSMQIGNLVNEQPDDFIERDSDGGDGDSD